MFIDEKYVNNEDVIKARYLISSESYNEAINILNDAISKDPENIEAFYERGRANFFLKDYSQVIMDMNETITLNITHPGAYFTRALAYKKNRQYELAYIDDCTYLQIKPSDANGYNNRGVTLGQLHREVESIEDFKKCLELEPEHKFALKSKADKEFNIGRFTDSIESLTNHVTKHDPDSIGNKLDIIEAHLCLGNIAEAGTILQEIKNFCKDGYSLIWEIFDTISKYASKQVDKSHLELVRYHIKKFEGKIPFSFPIFIKYFPLEKYPRWRGPRILKLLKLAEKKRLGGKAAPTILYQPEIPASIHNSVTCSICNETRSLTHNLTLSGVPHWVELSNRDDRTYILYCPRCKNTLEVDIHDHSRAKPVSLESVKRNIDINKLPLRAHTKSNIEAILDLFSTADIENGLLPLSIDGSPIDEGTYRSTQKYLKKHPAVDYPDAVALNFFNFASTFIGKVEMHSIMDQMEKYMKAETAQYLCPICGEYTENSDWCSECGNDI